MVGGDWCLRSSRPTMSGASTSGSTCVAEACPGEHTKRVGAPLGSRVDRRAGHPPEVPRITQEIATQYLLDAAGRIAAPLQSVGELTKLPDSAQIDDERERVRAFAGRADPRRTPGSDLGREVRLVGFEIVD